MSQMLEDMFDSGEDLSQGEYLVAAVQFKQPHLRGTKQSLPLSRQSLAGWRKLDPPKSRRPLPWEVVCLMALEAFSQKKVEISLYLLLAFVAYLRPGEVSRLRVCDLVAPVGTVKTWSLVLHPFEIGVPSKTAEFDETILFDIKPIQVLPPILHRRLRLGIRPKGELMFSTIVDEVRKFMNSVSDRFGMGAAIGDPHPYRLRISGPSRDVLMKHRTLQEVQKRGRWKKLQLSEAVRERGEGDTATSGLAKASTRQGNRCRRIHRKGGEWPALKVCKPVGMRIYLLVFSKHSSLSRAVSQICGDLVLLWDVHFGPEYDLRNPAKKHLVYQWVRGGGLSGIVVLTPAGTFSVTSTLRSESYPMRLPGLKSQQQISLANGNLWLRFSVRLVTLCWKLFVPAVLANPSNSRIWLTPPMSALQRLPRVTKAGSQLCCWEGTTRRSITFIGVNLEVEPLRDSTHCPKRTCLFTGHSHST